MTMQEQDRRRSNQIMRMRQLGYVTPKDAARRSRLHLRTIYRWMNDGFVESTMVGKRWYVNFQSLQKRLGALADLEPGGQP